MLNPVRKTINKFSMLTPGESVVVGVSGGADSIALLYILTDLQDYALNLIVAHINHGLRPREAKRDAEFVRKIANKLDRPFELREVDVLEFKKNSNLSTEDAARNLRYKFLKEVLGKYRADKIATGHTLDDQAETVLMRFIRGSGLLGLSGIPPVKDNIIRPLIEITRSDIEDYLKSKGIDWVEDSTNRMKFFLRNRIRQELIPKLLTYNPSVKETLARTGYIASVEEDYIRTNAKKCLAKLFTNYGGEELVGDLNYYKKLPIAIKYMVLRLAIEEIRGDLKGISLKHISSICELLLSDEPSGEIALPDKMLVAKGYDLFTITKRSIVKCKYTYSVNSTGVYKFPHAEFDVQISKVNSLTSEKCSGYFDFKSVEFPIEIRNFHHGDRFIPFGMKGVKKVKRFFIDEKVPRFLRNRIPIFTSSGEIMWIGGMRVDERFKVRNKNQEVITIRLVKPIWGELHANRNDKV